MRIAYIILAHKYPEQLVRLIYKLNTDDVSFFIHIDKKADDKFSHQVLTQLKDFPNVSFIKRYCSTWASFDIVRASLEGIKLIVESGTYFDYVIHLSGQDYLLKSNEQIQKFFQENKGREFIEYFPLPYIALLNCVKYSTLRGRTDVRPLKVYCIQTRTAIVYGMEV